MRIRELQIINFRNLAFVRGEFAPGLNVIHGANAQGKTNLLEAIYMLVTGRSFRTTIEREIIPWVRDEYEATLVRACVEKRGMEERLLLTFNSAEKHLFVNGNPIARLGELIGRINAVLFTPADLQLVRGGPGVRRRFMDVHLSQLDGAYLRHLQRYDLALRQRNALLRQHSRRPTLVQELAPWDSQLADDGAEIIRKRTKLIASLRQAAAAKYHQITQREEQLDFAYRPSPACDEPPTADGMLDAIRRSVETDLKRQTSNVGPHRDDFAFLIDARDARDFGSQGQQRSAVLAVKLAELDLMEAATGDAPLLLLDDLMSELDASRKGAFFATLNPRHQSFLTVTERDLLTGYADPDRVFAMDDGTLAVETISG